MFRCRIPIAIFLVLTLPLQSFASGTCCQKGQDSCCSVSANQPQDQKESCCSRTPAEAQPTGCKHCAAAEESTKAKQSSVDRCGCHCKQNPTERPATENRRQLNVESILTPRDSHFVVAKPLVPSPLKVEFTDRSPGQSLHAIHCVWLI